ncbi:DUF7319 domain-containing protein [Halalkalicoccus jeotgali]|uniref:DUF7319 domain-containing protein n=1 Tax=Halalkalicoccus jeotgali (strain DSM 18796 / CECT 7217 / JCM 14584 / KCTC 4019 / B3) TaxID=795797 RepID=D8J4Z2_HALJB|nr:hypothetical protein [Halalkalicoccus jeotgali]ADJ15609.1 hypothetical protein HacjB3_11130 [Halalkalicoccus jeotgali B3]ELY36313.1 hypothetical protein C497_11533 [Halalkalicoccus jeotgali B3]
MADGRSSEREGSRRNPEADPVHEEFDFEEFGPEDMARMDADDWDAAFDPESWITGEALIDRVEADLKSRIANRDVFAVLERFEGPPRLLAYSDEGYAIVYPDGSVEGEGTVVRDVNPTVALCSMDDYEVPDPPADWSLPDPESVPEGSGDLGNKMLQVIAFGLLLAGLAAIAGLIVGDMGGSAVIVIVIAVIFIAASVFLFLVVANARLSDRFRAVEYRNRLRAAGASTGERPAFVPIEDDEIEALPEDDGHEKPPSSGGSNGN